MLLWNFIKSFFKYDLLNLIRILSVFFNWRMVRGLGELQILTKVSYIMLIIVPILAATWSGVKLFINQDHRAVLEAKNTIDIVHRNYFNNTVISLSEELKLVAEEKVGLFTENKTETQCHYTKQDIQFKANEFVEVLDKYIDDYSKKPLDTNKLPWSFAAAFFAALSIAIAHMLYQISAPEKVKLMTMDAFILAKKEEFSKLKSSELIDNAKKYEQSKIGQRLLQTEKFRERTRAKNLYEQLINKYYFKDDKKYHIETKVIFNDDENKVLYNQKYSTLETLLSWINGEDNQEWSFDATEDRKRFNSQLKEAIEKVLNDPSFERNNNSEQMSIISRGAKVEYLVTASKNPIFIVITTGLYLFGLVIIFSIIKVQTINVFNAAGIENIFGILMP